MPLTAKALREKRAEIAKAIRGMADKVNTESRDFTAEEKPAWEKANADYNALTRSIEIAERAETVDADQAAPAGDRQIGRDDERGNDQRDTERSDRREKRAPTEEDRALTVQAWMRYQCDLDITERHEEAAKLVRSSFKRRSMDIALGRTRDLNALRRQMRAEREGRAQSALDSTKGGILNPDTLAGSFERAMLRFGGVREAASFLRTTRGEDLTMPTSDDTSNEGELLGENTEASDQDVAFAGTTWKAYKFSSKFIKVPYELIEDADAAVDLVGFIGETIGERIARKQNRTFTTGTGASQPVGIVTAATLGKTTASATAITFDEVLDLIHSVDPSYRQNAAFMLHDNVLLALRKLKDGQNRYLWESGGVAGGSADRIWGYPYVINQHMASSVATTNKTILFGDLSKYYVRDIGVLRLRRLVERYAEKDQEGFIGFFRSDGNLLDAGTHPVKYMAQT